MYFHIIIIIYSMITYTEMFGKKFLNYLTFFFSNQDH